MTYYITYTGKLIDIENVSEKDIQITDIAHHLCNIQRYNGALEFNKYYSVAHHCISLAQYAMEVYPDSDYNKEYIKAALLHDASEAYLGDIIGSVKKHLPDYKKLEHKLETIIFNKYEIDYIALHTVKTWDKRIVLNEAMELFPNYINVFKEQHKLAPLKITSLYSPKDNNTTELEYLWLCKLAGVNIND